MTDTNDIPLVKASFDRYFSRWDIELPLEDILARRRGKIVHRGWAIWYLFGSDQQGEYLDYYASHRMTDDSHVRTYADGTQVALAALVGPRITSPDPEEDARLEAEYLAENRKISAMLEEKGFGLSGDEPMSIQVNRYLRMKDAVPK